MAEWLYEAGIGEARAALVEDGRIVEARIERPGGLKLGAVLQGQLIERVAAGLSRVETPDGAAVIERVPPGITQGARLTVEVVREAIPEPGRAKLAKVTAREGEPCAADDLLARCHASGVPVRILRAHEPDVLEAAGWSEVLDEAENGEIDFPGGALRMSPTPAMTLFDVDGAGAPAPLAVAAARAAALAIIRLDIGGSIGIDFPTLGNKAERQAAAEAIDDALPQPFERTAINGFGFLQIIRPRRRASLPEMLRSDPVAAAALALLRAIERTPPPVSPVQHAGPRVAAWLADHRELVAELSRRTGVPISFVS